MLRALSAFILLATTQARAVNVVLGNDDGWATANIRAMYDLLTTAGHDVVLSSPADNKSGSGPLDLPAVPVLFGCQFESCPALSPAHGHEADNTKINYVNSFPVTAIRYGIETLAPQFFGGPPDLVLTGPNHGGNAGLLDGFTSGTLSAAATGAKAGIPAIAFSSISGDKVSHTSRPTGFSETYAGLATAFVQHILATGASPLLPKGIFISVNYPETKKNGKDCSKPAYVLARATPVIPFITALDIEVCANAGRLPDESEVIESSGCFASVVVLDMDSRLDVDAEKQAEVAGVLGDLLGCLSS